MTDMHLPLDPPSRGTIDVMHVRCAECGAYGDLLLLDQPAMEAIEEARDHVAREHPGRDPLDVLGLVTTTAHPPVGTDDVGAWVAAYNCRTRSARGMARTSSR
ncbi:hypothetical protein ABWJ92_38495 [Streptomyces sp. NPDC000609]|uniref:hypothetical protein n=1 Tax=Streptomyces sp. NPDC000609 TaxID=3160957 RepID=UPI003394B08E